MAKRAPDAKPLGRVALLPDVLAYDDLEGVGGAWQSLVDRIIDHQGYQGRIHLAVEDRWLIAYPATTSTRSADSAPPPEPPC